VKLPSAFLLLLGRGDWKGDNMAAVTNKRKVLSVEGKVKETREVRRGGGGGQKSRRVSGLWSRKFYDPNYLERQNHIREMKIAEC
jgi:hypothetical protein